jgi:hypothetical protein
MAVKWSVRAGHHRRGVHPVAQQPQPRYALTRQSHRKAVHLPEGLAAAAGVHALPVSPEVTSHHTTYYYFTSQNIISGQFCLHYSAILARIQDSKLVIFIMKGIFPVIFKR